MYTKLTMTRPNRLANWICLAITLVAGAANADSDASLVAGPALWQLSDNDNTVYLFGTFHLLPEEANWQTAAVKNALATTPVTVTEADTTSPEAQSELQSLIAQYGLNPPGTSLSVVLGDERASELNAIATQYGVNPEMLQPLRPWLALLSVAQAAYVSYGFNPQLGVETSILQLASTDGDSVEHLESIERQVTALAALEDEGLMNFVDVSLEEFANLEAQMQDSLAAWLDGDIDVLDEALVTSTRQESPRAFELIFASRNREWVDRIVDYLDGDTDTFIAVGTGHLIGEDSVIDLLAEKGIKATRVQ